MNNSDQYFLYFKKNVFSFRSFVLLCAFSLLVFLSFSNLKESPPTWLDEGAIDQVALNLATEGIYGYQISPDHFIGAGFLTTSYPLIYPVALFFKIFGASLLNARLIMVLFLFLIFFATYFLMKKLRIGEEVNHVSIYSILLLITFAPLYGHGKNMLGEVPGLVFFLISLLLLTFIQTSKAHVGTYIFWAGIFAGLSGATKPIYLVLLIPSAVLVFFIFYRKAYFLREKVLYFLGMIIPLLLWLWVHFSGYSPFKIIFSGNPDQVSVFNLIKENTHRLFFEFQPLYFLGLVSLWWLSIILRKKDGISLSLIEFYAISFSTLNLIFYLATRGFYRYFFPGEVIALIFLPISTFFILKFLNNYFRKIKPSSFLSVILLLVLFQTHQTFFNSWVSDFKDSKRYELLQKNLESLPPEKSILFYNVPEAVIFMKHKNFYQYMWFAENVQRGEENLPLLVKGIPDFILADPKFDYGNQIAGIYREKAKFDKYTLFEKILK